MKHKIYILDDHPIVIEGLKNIIDKQDDLQVIGSAEDAAAAVQQIGKLKPDIIILDITLKDRSGVDLIKKIRSTSATLKFSCIRCTTKMCMQSVASVQEQWVTS